MKKYEYKIFPVKKENFTSLTLLLSKYGEDGWKVLDIPWSDGGNGLSVLLEKEINVSKN